MAVTTESLSGGDRSGLVSIHGFDNAQTVKATADVQGGAIPALSPVVLKADGSAAVYATAYDAEASPLAAGDKIGFTKSDRKSEADGTVNVAVLEHAIVRYSALSTAAKAVIDAAEAAGAMGGIVAHRQ